MSDTEITLRTLAHLTKAGNWRLQLAHDRPHHTLIWTTRGQGRLLLDGQRRGLGTHNAVFVPAGMLFAVEMGPQSMGLVLTVPVGTPLRLPERPRLLRILDVHLQAEIAGLIDAAARENDSGRALSQDAMEAHLALISVWLRRQIAKPEHVPAPANAAARLSARFCTAVSAGYTSGTPMGQYATDLGVTPTHLTRAVKAATGRTAADILAQRVHHAAHTLLADTKHPAKDIARHLGFGSAAYFTRFVKQHSGQSPSQLRGG